MPTLLRRANAVRQVAERNKQAIRHWVERDWPRIKQTLDGAKPE